MDRPKRFESLKNFENYLKNNSPKIPKLPRSGEIWIQKNNPKIKWCVIGIYRIGDMYSLAMDYPDLDMDTIVVTCMHKDASISTHSSDTLDNFILKLEFFRKNI